MDIRDIKPSSLTIYPRIGLFLLFVGTISLICSCKSKKDPDVSNIKVDLDVIRFDKLFQAMDTSDIATSYSKLENELPAFAPLFFNNILPLRERNQMDNEALFQANISKYLKDDFVSKLYDTVQIVFPEMGIVEKDFRKGLQFLKYYFPEKGNYNLYGFISEFGYATFIFDDADEKEGLGLGLDMFLGSTYPYKSLMSKNATFSQYITRTFNKDHITKKLMDVIIADLMQVYHGERLIDKMIENGKKQYLLEKFLPYKEDTIKWEFTKEQMKWVEDNEVNIYVHILSEDLLYESNSKKIRSLIDVSPNSKGMPPEAPGRTANYIGYKIIDKFMIRNNISLDSLIRIKDAQFILDNSRYKPLNKRR